MVNTSMWHHPKYYKELRKRNKLDQAISRDASTEDNCVRPGPGLKPQAPSDKQQATSSQTSSDKHQASSNKHQAASRKRQAAQ